MSLSLLVAILAALAVGSCAGFILGGIMAAGKIADLADECERLDWALYHEARALAASRNLVRSTRAQRDEAHAGLAKFDHDGDGRPGGSLKKGAALTADEFKRVVDTCENPPPPSDKLRSLMAGGK